MSRKGIMLAYPFDPNRLKRWQRPWAIQPKLDGDRARAMVGQGNRPVLLSSEEKPIVSLPHIVQELDKCFSSAPTLILDGELYIPGCAHQEIHGIVSRKKELHPNHERVEYHIFDIAVESPDLTQEVRTSILEEIIRPMVKESKALKIVSTDWVSSPEGISNYLSKFLDEGYEGFILRNRTGIYRPKRSTDMMKFKPRRTDTYEIVGTTEEVSIEGIPKGTLGAFLCKKDNQIFGVGTGPALTREARQSLWKDRASLVGKLLVVKYQQLTEGGIPRFPVAVEIIDSSALLK